VAVLVSERHAHKGPVVHHARGLNCFWSADVHRRQFGTPLVPSAKGSKGSSGPVIAAVVQEGTVALGVDTTPRQEIFPCDG
jgi:hypothetical protein